MTGDSISDAEVLKRADVGLAMGSGCDVAKDNSDLVILDNRFESIHSVKIVWVHSKHVKSSCISTTNGYMQVQEK